jgi:hypothetical protein
MTDAAKPATDESEDESQDESENESQDESVDESATEVPNRLSENDAVAECLRAWRITMENERAELDEDENEYDAEKKANKAFLAALPPLSGHQNVCDFIACVTQAYICDIIRRQQAEHLFAAARVAMCALRLNPQKAASARRDRRRRRKSPPGEKIS